MSLPYTGLSDEVTPIARQILVIPLIAAVTWLVAQLILVVESPLWDRQDWVLQVVDTIAPQVPVGGRVGGRCRRSAPPCRTPTANRHRAR
jgi:hypothetical protein